MCNVFKKKFNTRYNIYEETLFDDDVTKACIFYLKDYTNEIISLVDFIDIKKETLTTILKLYVLMAIEYDLFWNVCKWIIKQA